MERLKFQPQFQPPGNTGSNMQVTLRDKGKSLFLGDLSFSIPNGKVKASLRLEHDDFHMTNAISFLPSSDGILPFLSKLRSACIPTKYASRFHSRLPKHGFSPKYLPLE
jgi:hypothetical protein